MKEPPYSPNGMKALPALQARRLGLGLPTGALTDSLPRLHCYTAATSGNGSGERRREKKAEALASDLPAPK